MDLEKLIAELAEAERRQQETELSPDAFAVFWMLQRREVAKAMEVAREIATAFEHHPHWRTSERHEQDVRKAIYKALINTGAAEGVKDVADAILKMLGRATA